MSADSDESSDQEFPEVSQKVLQRLMEEGMETLSHKSGSLASSEVEAVSQPDDYFAERNLTDLTPCYTQGLRRKNWARFPAKVARTPFAPKPPWMIGMRKYTTRD
ncbi:hypothetical protein GGTG_09791 [Gaeumannomyces tritici R3-111a-1]|uniref:Uncharacterized protein n=1 Tax=Gaeumannomyces tritici (strain R3-111a-1) TaxID=644352 RepID=J3P8F7_GAET3|nr:hypothetical protein GGTG_09791 [Gaeumannomyces tritici R3-111a-1]EJT72940.1 hypothetical protein GGTG_09791 [Gaeumannomyces tritici R3-111a-1]